MNSRMFATPIGRNCRKPWISATSDDARLTSWPVCISSWRAKSSRWSWRKIAVRRSCCTSSAMRPPRKRRKYAKTNVNDAHHDHQREPRRRAACGCCVRVMTSSMTTFCTTGSSDWMQLAADRHAERDVRVLLVRLHVADEPADPTLLLRRRRVGHRLTSRDRSCSPRAAGPACGRRARRRDRTSAASSASRSRACSKIRSSALAHRALGGAQRRGAGRREREPDRAAVAGHRLAGERARARRDRRRRR